MAKKKTRQTVKTRKALELSQFEQKIRLRQTRASDYKRLVEIQSACFPGMPGWNKEHIESQIGRFPAGQMVIAIDDVVVASASSVVVDFSEYEAWHDWKVIADNGFITNHDPEGDTLYGIEIMVHPDAQGMRLSRRLYEARKELCRRLNLTRIIIAGRIPGYHEHAEGMTAREYAEYVLYKDLYDPVLTPQLANGFVLKGLIPEYLKDDVHSRGYATHLEWTNVEYQSPRRRRYQAVANVRVSAVQWEMRALSSFDEFCQQVEFYVDVAGDYHSDFVVFPELFTLELLSLVRASQPGRAARQLADYTPKYIELMADLAVRYHVNIVGGSQFTLEGDELFNVAYLFQRNGQIGKQYKIHITPNERRWWGISPGHKLEVFETDAGRVAINVCYDIEFPELARFLATRGVRILFVPFNTNERSAYARVRYCAQARCIENHMYTVIAGCVGNLPFVENADIHYAQSAIFSPCDVSFGLDGIVATCTPNIDQVLTHDLDLELVRRHRHTGTTLNWRDRRRDLYHIEFKDLG